MLSDPLLLAQIRRMSLGCWLLTALPSFLLLELPFSVLVFCMSLSFSFLPAAVLLVCCPPQHAGTSSFLHRALSRGSSVSVPTGNPFQPAEGGFRKPNCFFSPLPNELSLPALAWPGMLNTPSLYVAQCPEMLPCHPRLRIPGCSLGQAEQGEEKAQSPKPAIHQDQEAEGNSLSSSTGVKLRWEATQMGNSPFPDRAGVGSVPSRDRGMVPAAESTDSGVASVVIALTPLWPVFQPRNNQ